MKIITLLFALASFLQSLEISSWTNHPQKVDFANQTSRPYQISVTRINSNTPDEPYHCRASGRSITYNKSQELFRLDTHLSANHHRNQSVLKNLLELSLQEEIINFEVSGQDYYVVTSKNSIYYLKHNKGQKYLPPAESNLPLSVKQSVQKGDFFLLGIQNGVAIILGQESFVCHGAQCSYISGWESIPVLTHATFTKANNGKQYIMVAYISGFSILEYNGKGGISGIKKFDSTFFNKSSISIYDINADAVNDSEIYVLDYEQGVYMIKYQNNDPSHLSQASRILNVNKCFSMDNNGYKYFVLICRSQIDQSDYLIEVHYHQKNNTFSALIPKNQEFQKIVDVELAPNYYLSWARSGFKFYWMSTNNHYPEEYRKAGELFFYNTIQARFKTFNNKNYLYYATPNTVQRLQISQMAPFVSCSSDINTQQTYNITYAAACQDKSDNICTKSEQLVYQATKHRDISYVLYPLILSVLGVIFVCGLIVVVFCNFRKKERQILDKTQSYQVQVDDLGDMVAPDSVRT